MLSPSADAIHPVRFLLDKWDWVSQALALYQEVNVPGRIRTTVAMLAAAALGFVGVSTVSAAFPSSVAQNTAFGNRYLKCAVQVQAGYFLGFPYAKILDSASGSGCNTVSAKLNYFPANGGKLVAKVAYRTSPPDGVWYQASADSVGTIFSVEFLQESSNGCWYRTTWAPGSQSTLFQVSSYSVAPGCAAP